ncbi:MAG: hypothetical protein JW757_11520 [Anaerolineales bacterium]|nr:hypothetical protein [Anaerolineales bacterium]
MDKFRVYLVLLVAVLMLFSCNTLTNPDLRSTSSDPSATPFIITDTAVPSATPPNQEQTPTPEERNPEVITSGPFQRTRDLDPVIFGQSIYPKAVISHNYETNITTVEGLYGQIQILSETIRTREIGEEYLLIGFDEDGLAYLINQNDGMIHRMDTDWNNQVLQENWLPIEEPVILQGTGVTTDWEGNLWLATQFDVRRFDGQQWAIWTRDQLGMDTPEEIPPSPIKIFAFNQTKNLWLASCEEIGPGPMGGGGARWWDGASWYGAGTIADNGCVHSVHQDQTGAIWLGVDQILWKMNPATGEWQSQSFLSPTEDKPRAYAYKINVSPTGEPWIVYDLCGGASCYDFQLNAWLNDEWQPIGEIAYLPQEVYFSPHGSIWVLDMYGVYLITDGQPVLVSDIYPLTAEIDPNGKLWLVGKGPDGVIGLWEEIGP